MLPDPVPLTEPEREHAARFLEHVRALGAADVQVIKIDPMQLVVAQYCITIDIAAAYAERCQRDDDWLTQALPLSVENPNVNMSFTRRNFDTDIDIDLPHAEFIFGVHPHGGFGPKEFLGYVMVKNLGSRMLLGKGYHRLYGRVSSTGASLPERLSLVAIEPGVLTPPSSEAASGPGLEIFGPRPALFSDFFTEGLAMPVYLRRKRYQLQVRSRWVAINES